MSLALPVAAGTFVIPDRSFVQLGLPDEHDLRVDFAGIRSSDPGRIVEPLPTEPSTVSTNSWDPTYSNMTPVLRSDVLVYNVEVFNIDTQAVEVHQYPATDLTLPSSSYGVADAVAYDGDAPSPDLARITAAERYAR